MPRCRRRLGNRRRRRWLRRSPRQVGGAQGSGFSSFVLKFFGLSGSNRRLKPAVPRFLKTSNRNRNRLAGFGSGSLEPASRFGLEPLTAGSEPAVPRFQTEPWAGLAKPTQTRLLVTDESGLMSKTQN